MAGPTHLQFIFKLHSVIKTSEAAMILTHPSGWTQSGELWRTLLCSASNLFQQIERKPPLIACKTGQKRSFSECFAHQGLCSIMLQETTGLKQQWGSNGASANAWPASWLQPRVEITYATKSHERSGEPAELGLKRWPLPWWGGEGGSNSWMEKHGLDVCPICPAVGKRLGLAEIIT